MDSGRRNWLWVLLAALAIACVAPSTGGIAGADRGPGSPAVTNISARLVEPAVLAGADASNPVVESNRALPDRFVRVFALLAALGIAAAATRGRSRLGVPVRVRPRPGRRGDVLVRGPPCVAC